MISPSVQQAMQEKIDELIERAKADPSLLVQVDDALAAAQRRHDAAVASGLATGGLISAQYQELLNRGLLVKST